MKPQHGDVIVAMTGASGAAYGLRLMERLGELGVRQHILLSDAARIVLKQEQGIDVPAGAPATMAFLSDHLNIPGERIQCYDLMDWYAPAASGSAGIRHMVVVPCSMGSLARIATGASDNLLERAADVMLKERGRLIIVPRETPLSTIHLEHMLKLSQMGVHVLPAMPGFYHHPEKIGDLIDFVVERMIDHLELHNTEAKRWGA